VDLGVATDELLADLIQNTPWRQEQVTVWGKSHPQPRLIAWYGDAALRYSYSGITLTALPWTPALQALRRQLEAHSGAAFNSVLLNYYRDQRDSMGLHADDEPELGSQPVIASLSLGATRTLVFKHRRAPAVADVRLPLTSGSLLLMRGATQACWKHGINKQTRGCGPRVNLTFRRVITFTEDS
jgi:alkylated DNA repair dioxygenase AlkB